MNQSNRAAKDRSAAAFDPAASSFVAMQARPSCLAPLDAASLPAFLRAALVIDGTVTRFIEAWAGEPIVVECLEQAEEAAGDAARWLATGSREPVLRRRSLLLGVDSGRLYVYADSLIVPSRLSADMRAGLASEPQGLGKILRDSGLETRREGLWYGREQLELPVPTVTAKQLDCLSRSYRVVASGRPLMLITERFPLEIGV